MTEPFTGTLWPDCKVWHSRRDLVGAGPFWLVRIWCGLWHTGAVRCGLMLCGADFTQCSAEMQMVRQQHCDVIL